MQNEKKQLLTIGELARICNISTKTLRHYDKKNILNPTWNDPMTGYRYYSFDNIIIINIIKELKNLGFQLTDIGDLIKERDIKKFIDLYQNKKQNIEQQINQLKINQQRIENRIQHLEDLSKNKTFQQNSIELKQINKRKICFKRTVAPCNPKTFSVLLNKLLKTIAENNYFQQGPLMAIFHDDYKMFNPEKADMEVCVEVKTKNNKVNPSHIRTIEPGLFITTICKGPYNKLIEGYKKLVAWIDNNNYQINGKSIEIYLVDFLHTKSENNFITELQVPIKKRK